MAAKFHHDDLVVIALQKGQGFREDAGRFGNWNVSHGGIPAVMAWRYRAIAGLAKIEVYRG
jgi:hypothetical protein